MASWEDEDARDLELQRELQSAYERYLHAVPLEKLQAKNRYMALLREFTRRVGSRMGTRSLSAKVGTPGQ